MNDFIFDLTGNCFEEMKPAMFTMPPHHRIFMNECVNMDFVSHGAEEKETENVQKVL